jgi:hypothetical protein
MVNGVLLPQAAHDQRNCEAEGTVTVPTLWLPEPTNVCVGEAEVAEEEVEAVLVTVVV